MVGPRWVVSITYLVAAASVVLRRARPGIAFAVGFGALAVQALAVGTSEGNGSLFPGLVLSYSVAAHGARRTAIAGLCAIPVVAGLREVLNPENTTAAEIFNGLGWDFAIIAAWLLGAWIRTRRQLLVELRQQAADSAEVAAAAERARVARELHDMLAHSLAVVVVQAEAAEEALAHRPEVAAESMRSIQRTGREALVEVRRLVGVLSEDDAMREPVPGAAAVDALVERMNAAGLPVDLEVRGSTDALPAGPDLAVYRIVQESLTNVLKHAVGQPRPRPDRPAGRSGDGRGGGRRAGCRNSVGSGRGRATGHGLRGMQERVTALGGASGPARAADGGFAVRAVLPHRGVAVIRVLLADDQELVRDGFATILDLQADIEVVGSVADGSRAMRSTRDLRPDVVLMDVRMPVMDGIEATRRIMSDASVETRVLVLTTFDNDEYVFEALQAGASGFLLKDTPRAGLIAAIRSVALGETLLSPQITHRLVERFARRVPGPDAADSPVAGL